MSDSDSGWQRPNLHHPSGVGMDGVVKIFRLIYFFGDVL